MREIIAGLFAAIVTVFFIVVGGYTLNYFLGNAVDTTQPAVQTTIVDVRGCDIIQMLQADKLIAAFPAPDQPKSCKVQQTKAEGKKK